MYPSDPNAGYNRKITGISVQYYKRNVYACSWTFSFQTSGQTVFQDRKMIILTLIKQIAFPLLILGMLRIVPVTLDDTLKNVMILTAALPASSAQSMITEQYGTNTTGAGRSVFMTTLFSVITVPLIMMIAFA